MKTTQPRRGLSVLIIVAMTVTQVIPYGFAEGVTWEQANATLTYIEPQNVIIEEDPEIPLQEDETFPLTPVDEESNVETLIDTPSENTPKFFEARKGSDALNCREEGWRLEGDHAWRTRANASLDYLIEFNEAGEYDLAIHAKNRGKIPSTYDYFEVDVLLNGEYHTTIMINADMDTLQTGSGRLTIEEPGEYKVTLKWKNDYWNPAMRHDANIVIAGIEVSSVEDDSVEVDVQPIRKLYTAAEAVNGDRDGWKEEDGALWRTRAGMLKYRMHMMKGKNKIKMWAKNRGQIPASYKSFDVEVYIDGKYVSTVGITANMSNYESALAELDIDLEGDYEVGLKWRNDYWDPANGHDANIMLKDIELISGEEPAQDQDKKPMLELVNKDLREQGWRRYNDAYWNTRAGKPFHTEVTVEAPGEYKLSFEAMNKGRLPESYTDFEVEVIVNGVVVSTVWVNASDDEWDAAAVTIDFAAAGQHDVALRWKNDYWDPIRGYDANIMIRNVDLVLVEAEVEPESSVEMVLNDGRTIVINRDGSGTVTDESGNEIEYVDIRVLRGNTISCPVTDAGGLLGCMRTMMGVVAPEGFELIGIFDDVAESGNGVERWIFGKKVVEDDPTPESVLIEINGEVIDVTVVRTTILEMAAEVQADYLEQTGEELPEIYAILNTGLGDIYDFGEFVNFGNDTGMICSEGGCESEDSTRTPVLTDEGWVNLLTDLAHKVAERIGDVTADDLIEAVINGLPDEDVDDPIEPFVFPTLIEVNGKNVQLDMEDLMSRIQEKMGKARMASGEICFEGCSTVADLSLLKGIQDLFPNGIGIHDFDSSNNPMIGGDPLRFTDQGWAEFIVELITRLDAGGHIFAPAPAAGGVEISGTIIITLTYILDNDEVVRILVEGIADTGPEYPTHLSFPDLGIHIVQVDMPELIDAIQKARREAEIIHTDATGQIPIHGYPMDSLLFLQGIADVFMRDEIMAYEMTEQPNCSFRSEGLLTCMWTDATPQFTVKGWIDFTTELIRRYAERDLDIFGTLEVEPFFDLMRAESVLEVKVLDHGKLLKIVKEGIHPYDNPSEVRMRKLVVNDLTNTFGLTEEQVADYLEEGLIKIVINTENNTATVLFDESIRGKEDGLVHIVEHLGDPLGGSTLPHAVNYEMGLSPIQPLSACALLLDGSVDCPAPVYQINRANYRIGKLSYALHYLDQNECHWGDESCGRLDLDSCSGAAVAVGGLTYCVEGEQLVIPPWVRNEPTLRFSQNRVVSVEVFRDNGIVCITTPCPSMDLEKTIVYQYDDGKVSEIEIVYRGERVLDGLQTTHYEAGTFRRNVTLYADRTIREMTDYDKEGNVLAQSNFVYLMRMALITCAAGFECIPPEPTKYFSHITRKDKEGKMLSLISGMGSVVLKSFPLQFQAKAVLADGSEHNVIYRTLEDLLERVAQLEAQILVEEPEYPSELSFPDLGIHIVQVDMPELIDAIQKARREAEIQHTDATGQIPIHGYPMDSLLFLQGIADVFMRDEIMAYEMTEQTNCTFTSGGLQTCTWTDATPQFTVKGWIDFTTELIRRYAERDLDIFGTLQLEPFLELMRVESVLEVKVLDHGKLLKIVKEGIHPYDNPSEVRLRKLVANDLTNTFGLTEEQVTDYLEEGLITIAINTEYNTATVLFDESIRGKEEGLVHKVEHLGDPLGGSVLPHAVNYELSLSPIQPLAPCTILPDGSVDCPLPVYQINKANYRIGDLTYELGYFRHAELVSSDPGTITLPVIIPLLSENRVVSVEVFRDTGILCFTTPCPSMDLEKTIAYEYDNDGNVSEIEIVYSGNSVLGAWDPDSYEYGVFRRYVKLNKDRTILKIIDREKTGYAEDAVILTESSFVYFMKMALVTCTAEIPECISPEPTKHFSHIARKDKEGKMLSLISGMGSVVLESFPLQFQAQVVLADGSDHTVIYRTLEDLIERVALLELEEMRQDLLVRTDTAIDETLAEIVRLEIQLGEALVNVETQIDEVFAQFAEGLMDLDAIVGQLAEAMAGGNLSSEMLARIQNYLEEVELTHNSLDIEGYVNFIRASMTIYIEVELSRQNEYLGRLVEFADVVQAAETMEQLRELSDSFPEPGPIVIPDMMEWINPVDELAALVMKGENLLEEINPQETAPVKRAIDSLLALIDFAQIDRSEINVLEVREYTWTNGCVGWALSSGELCTTVIVTDYIVVLELYGNIYEFHNGRLDLLKRAALLAMEDSVERLSFFDQLKIISSELYDGTNWAPIEIKENEVWVEVVLGRSDGSQIVYRVNLTLEEAHMWQITVTPPVNFLINLE